MDGGSPEVQGTLFGLGDKGESTPVKVRIWPAELTVSGKDVPNIHLRYTAVTVELGADDEYWVFKGREKGKELILYIRDDRLPALMRQAGVHASMLERVGALGVEKTTHIAWRRIALVALIALIGTALVGMYVGLPILLDMTVDSIPVEWEEELGASAAAGILEDGEFEICNDTALLAAVNELTGRLANASTDHPYTFTFTVLDSPMVNAFALPGGQVFLTIGLLNATDDVHAIAGVLGHEMTHVTSRHGLRNVVAGAGIRIMVAIIMGGTDSELVELAPLAGELSALAFSREQEREADNGGLELLYAARLDPDGLARFFDMLAEDEDMLVQFMEVASTHPVSEDRSAALRTVIAARSPSPVEPLATDWQGLVIRCDATPPGDPFEGAAGG